MACSSTELICLQANKQNGISIGWAKRGGSATASDAQLFEHSKAMHHSTMLLRHCMRQHAILKVHEVPRLQFGRFEVLKSVTLMQHDGTHITICSGTHQPNQTVLVYLKEIKRRIDMDSPFELFMEAGLTSMIINPRS